MTRAAPATPWPEGVVRGDDRLLRPASSTHPWTFTTHHVSNRFTLKSEKLLESGDDMTGQRTASPRRACLLVVTTSLTLLAALLAPTGSATAAGDRGPGYERAVVAELEEVEATRTRRTHRLVRVATGDRADRLRKAVVTVTNRRRAAHGLRPLRRSPCPAQFARRHSARMAERAELFHADMAALRKRCSARAVAENVALHSSPTVTARRIVRAWMRSPVHRANILDPRLTHLGVGVAQHPGSGAWYATQDFLRVR
jgi:uncharacterized protein YkwD